MNYDSGAYSDAYLPRQPTPEEEKVCCPHCKGTGLMLRSKFRKRPPGSAVKKDLDERNWQDYVKGPTTNRNTSEPLYYRRDDREMQEAMDQNRDGNDGGNWFGERNESNWRKDEDETPWRRSGGDERMNWREEPVSWDDDRYSGHGFSGGDGYFGGGPDRDNSFGDPTKMSRKQRRKMMKMQREIGDKKDDGFDGPPAAAGTGKGGLDYTDFPPMPEFDAFNEPPDVMLRDLESRDSRAPIPPLMPEHGGPNPSVNKRLRLDFSQNRGKGTRGGRKRRNNMNQPSNDNQQRQMPNQQRRPNGPRLGAGGNQGSGDMMPGNMPSVDGMSEIDIFSLGVLYANYMQ